MNKFRVYDKENDELFCGWHKSFMLDQDGNLFEVNKKNGLLIKYDTDKVIIMHCINRKDISGRDIYEGDILNYPTGYKFLVAFGEHDAFCPGDQMNETNQGFVAVRFDGDSPDYNEVYPLSSTESLTRVIGHYINGKARYYPELIYEMWHCPCCGEIIVSDGLASAPEFEREELLTCDCCSAEFDLNEWEKTIDELNEIKGEIYED